MSRTKYFFVILFFPLALSAQSKVDRLVYSLDSLSATRFDNWRCSTQFAPRGTPLDPAVTAKVQDSGWETLRLDQSIYVDSCWIRKEIVLPKYILGRPVRGKITFALSVDDYGYLWVNGENRGYFPWNGEFVLTEDAKPGMKFLLAIKAINTGGPLRLIRAQFKMEDLQAVRQRIDAFTLSLRVGEKLLGFDTYQTNARTKSDPGIDKSKMAHAEKENLQKLLQNLAEQVEVAALAAGDTNRFFASVNTVRARLQPIRDYAKRFTLYFDANAHIDAAWLWREKETVEVCKNTFSSVLNMMNVRPDFTYTQSAAAYYDWMQTKYPELFRGIQDRVQEGRWEIIGGMWVEPDCNLPAGESWARHLLYAQRYFKKSFGKMVKIGWNPDSFGYNWNMPQFYQNAGIEAFITQKIGWNDTNVFPYRTFWWQAPDSSRILSYFPFDYVNSVENPFQLVDWLRQFEANTGFTKLLILFGVGDHGGGPSLAMIDRIESFKALDIFPSIEYGTTSQYLDWLKQQDLTELPVWDSELYLEYHRGTSTTQAKIKAANRSSEILLTNAEKFASIANLYGRPYDRDGLQAAWRDVLFNQFHDILPGSGIREIYIDALEKYRDARTIGNFELSHALEKIATQINTAKAGAGKPVVVFNPLAWERKDLVRVQLAEGDTNTYAVFNSAGQEITGQTITTGKYHREIIFVADAVPALGYAVYLLKNQPPAAHANSLQIAGTQLENEFFRIALSADSGWVQSIFDKRFGRELLAGQGNRLQILEDRPSDWDAWNIGLTGKEFPSTLRKIEIVETGPVRAVLRVYRDYLKPGVRKGFPTEDFPSSFFVQDVILYSGIDRIDFQTEVDWWEDKTMLKVAFPLAVEDSVATYEIPYGTIERPTTPRTALDKAKWEVSAQRWVDISARDLGVSLLNRSKYGHDVKGSRIRLSLLRSPKWPDPTADRGKHSIAYALYPHRGSYREGGTVHAGYEYNQPLQAIITGSHGGKLPSSQSFVKLAPANLVLTTIKKAEDADNVWVLQWYDAEGAATQAVLTLPFPAKKAVLSNFLEEDGAPLVVNKNTVKVATKKNAVTTIKVYF